MTWTGCAPRVRSTGPPPAATAPFLAANSFILNGDAGTLGLIVGANAATVQQNAVVAGTETRSVGANAGAVSITLPERR